MRATRLLLYILVEGSKTHSLAYNSLSAEPGINDKLPLAYLVLLTMKSELNSKLEETEFGGRS